MEPLLVTRASQKEYNSELGSQNDSKMEPKMEPKRPRSTLTKHAQAWSDCISTPLGKLHFHCFFRVHKQIIKNHLQNDNFENLEPNWPQSDPVGRRPSRQMGSQKSPFRTFYDPRDPRGAPGVPEEPKTTPRYDFLSIWERFWMIFHRFLVNL